MAGSKHQKGTIIGDLAALLESGNDSDVTLVAGDARIEAHRLILATRSRVFAERLRSHQEHACLEIRDTDKEVLHQLLTFIYTDEAPALARMAPELLVAADKYDLKVLRDRCEQQMVRDICTENAAAGAVLAVELGCPALRRAAVDFIRSHSDSVKATRGWTEAQLSHPKALANISRLVEGGAQVENRTPPQQAASSQETYRAPRGPEDLASRRPLGVLKSKSHSEGSTPPDMTQTPGSSSSREKSESTTADTGDVTNWFAVRMGKAAGPKSGPLSSHTQTPPQELQVSGKSPSTEARSDTGNKSQLEAETQQNSTHDSRQTNNTETSQIPPEPLSKSKESQSSTKATSSEHLAANEELPWWLPVLEAANM